MEQEGILVFKLLTSRFAGKSTNKATVTVGQCVRTVCTHAVCQNSVCACCVLEKRAHTLVLEA